MPLIRSLNVPDAHVYNLYPAERPASLDRLHGPSTGRLVLPLDVYWGPGREKGFDLSKPTDIIYAYTEIVANGTARQQESMLNKRLLTHYWPLLSIDTRRIRPAWERAFPQLKESRLTWKALKENGA